MKKLAKEKKTKIPDEDKKEAVDYSTFKQYLEKEIWSNFNRIVLPNFEGKMKEKIDNCSANLIAKHKKILALKYILQTKSK